ncbi:MAG: Phosphatidate cytidylyltransferase [candidate division TM6 bacterium GW2011_GWF2_43_87]|nr:MAG: Phosphatidate cytidylyltransferase [candidate division TM6 bacterium GW2011_GWF2_43_87]
MKVIVQRALSGALFILLLAGTYFYAPAEFFTLLLLGILGVILAVEWPAFGPASLTPWYPIAPFVLLMMLNQTDAYRHIIVIIFASAMIFDTGSYLVGTWLGRWRIAPTISPKKTWEGVAGGVVASFLILLLPSVRHLFLAQPTAMACLIIGMDAFALAGDIFVSFLKRRAGVKDCGVLLPGHGGLLDRFDSILFVTFLLFALRRYL